jgi:uncharacterized protein (TIGR01777 family)
MVGLAASSHPTIGSMIPHRILLSGASGFVGGAIKQRLEGLGCEVVPLTRQPMTTPHVWWKPEKGALDAEHVAGFDAVVHLAGANIAHGRWTAARKQEIWSSRVDATRLLCEKLLASGSPPKSFIAASAIGWYGSRGDELLDDRSSRGEGFLSDLCNEWEKASAGLEAAGVRVCRLRIGVVFDPSGATLGKLIPLFRWCLGGRLGPGTQWMSWVSRRDVVDGFRFALERDLRGTFTLTSPNPVTNAEFTRLLAAAVKRPAVFSMPSWALKLALGEMGDELLLSSTRAVPSGLLSNGFQFQHPELSDFLRQAVV